MKVIVIGATGSLGQVAVEHLLHEGHTVTGFARSPEKLDMHHKRLALVAGDATSSSDVSNAIAGHDAVVIALGSGNSRSSKIRSVGTLTVIQAMQALGIDRLICQSTLGTFETRANLNFLWKYVLFGVLLRPVLKDHELQEQMVRASGLDWTIVRPSAFADGPVTGAYKEGFAADERRLTLKISRADIASFIARVLGEHGYRREAVAISN